MKVGTKSILFGYHAFWIHPFLVAWAWFKLYGFPWDPRLWVAFFVHDIGYIGKPNMDGPEGQNHPFVGADVMHWLFDNQFSWHWHKFIICHSRTLAKACLEDESKLCWADKYAFLLYPVWLLKLLYGWSGEGEYYYDNNWAMEHVPGARNFETWYPCVLQDTLISLKRGLDEDIYCRIR